MRLRFFFTFVILLSGATLSGQSPEDHNEGLTITHDPASDTSTISWWGQDGRTYFIQTSEELENWTYAPFIEPGLDGVVNWGEETNAERLFMLLKYTDIATDDPWGDDFDGDGIGNMDELTLVTDPFNPTDIDALWLTVPLSWKESLVAHPDAAYYDPDGLITSVEDITPGADYDGDGIPNILEYKEGTDPADFFNGNPAFLHALGGDAQTGTPSSILSDYLYISVLNSNGGEWSGAPIRIVVNEGHAGLGLSKDSQERYSALTLRNSYSCTRLAFETPLPIGTSTVTASLPNGENMTFHLYTVDAAAKARQGVTGFTETDNGDGTSTYNWNAGPAAGDFFKLQELQSNGTWQVFYETTYGSADLPLVEGQTAYSLTLPNQ